MMRKANEKGRIMSLSQRKTKNISKVNNNYSMKRPMLVSGGISLYINYQTNINRIEFSAAL
jgi:hypothetical protein